MKKILFFLFIIIFFGNKILADEFFVSSENNKTINIFNKNGDLISHDLKKFISFLQEGDKLFFKRGEKFNLFIDLSDKNDIVLDAYGDENLSRPIINYIIKIPFDDKNESSSIYPSSGESPWNDESWNNLINSFDRYLIYLAGFTKEKIALKYDQVKDKIHQILRIKLPYLDSNFDAVAVRIWKNNEELLRTLYFEELNCTDCEYKIRYFYEKNTNFLYLFSNDPNIELNSILSDLYINNANYFTIKITNAQNITIKNLDIRGGKYAVIIRNSKNINILDSKIGNGSFTGIYATNDIKDITKGTSNLTIDHCIIDGNFKFDYRFYSERGSQDGIFLLNNVSDSTIKNSVIKHWGHTGVNLAVNLEISSTNLQNAQVINNKIFNNTIDGQDVSYMRALTFDGEKCQNNEFYFNVVKNMEARSQINGMNNIIKYNIFYNTKNSQLKKDQGYGSGEALQLEAYGKSNTSSHNIIERNLILKSDEPGISLSSNDNSGNKEDNSIKDNILIDCGNKMFIPFENYKKDYNQTALEIIDYTKSYDTIIGNDFIANKIYTPYSNSFIFYKGELLTAKEFNLKSNEENNETIKDNIEFSKIDTSKIDDFEYSAENFTVSDPLLFIYRYYLNIFKRVPDQGGLLYWTKMARELDQNLTDTNTTKTAFEIAQYFFTSPELRDQNLSNDEFIKRIYYTMLNREPDRGGFDYWKNRIENEGVKREAIFYEVTFVTDEFKKSSEEYSLVAYDQKDKLSSFIQRIYIYTLDRLADPSGLNYWLNSLLSGEKSASDIVKNFFHSQEFLAKNLSDKEFVITVYRAVMGRDGDEGGINFWVEKLEENLSRDQLLENFLNSEEFKKLSESYGIKNI